MNKALARIAAASFCFAAKKQKITSQNNIFNFVFGLFASLELADSRNCFQKTNTDFTDFHRFCTLI